MTRGSKHELPLDRGLMQRLSNFTLKDVTNGRSLMLYGFQGKQAIAWCSSATIARSSTSTCPG